MVSDDPKRDWKIYGYKLEAAERELSDIVYTNIFKQHVSILAEHARQEIPNDSLTIDHIDSLLTGIERVPRGLNLLSVETPPRLPKIPLLPSGVDRLQNLEFWSKRAAALEKRRSDLHSKFFRLYLKDYSRANRLRSQHKQRNSKAIELLSTISIWRHPLPALLKRRFRVRYNFARRRITCTLNVPNLNGLPILKRRGEAFPAKWQEPSPRERKKIFESILFSLCIRAAFLIARSNVDNQFDFVIVNARMRWSDPATGKPRTGIIASFSGPAVELNSIRPEQVDYTKCFRHFGGKYSSSIDSIVPVDPL